MVETTYTLGLEVQRDSASGRLLLSQRKFVATILERFSKYVPPLCSIPMDPAAGAALSMQQSPDTKFAQDAMAAFPYRQLIGSLMYLMIATRPDLTFSLSKLSKFNNSPGRTHWEAACTVLGYLRQTGDVRLYYTHEAPLQIQGL